MNEKQNALPIGVFDSGVGGLTVLRALQEKLPKESFLYLGDTARLPYGTKSAETIVKYVHQAVSILIERGIKLLVIACNTAASNVSEIQIQKWFPSLPFVGVLEPGAKVACETTKTGKILVLATEATVRAEGYQNAIKKIHPSSQVITQGCSVFVSLAEEGWVDGIIAEESVKKYLNPIMQHQTQPHIDCIVLGCTHFPVFQQAIKKVVGNKINIVDSAKTTADVVAEKMQELKLQNDNQFPLSTTFLVTDAPERFARVAKQFLNLDILSKQIELVDLNNK